MKGTKIRKSVKVSPDNHAYLFSSRVDGESIDAVLTNVIKAAKIVSKKDGDLIRNKKVNQSVGTELIPGNCSNENSTDQR